MVTSPAPPQRRARTVWRRVRWLLFALLVLIVGLLVFALVRPLELLAAATEVRLWFDGIHSETTNISLAGVGPVRIHYYVGGTAEHGPPVVLVHGLGGRAEDWANLMPRLVRDHHRVYALDLPGYGQSGWPTNATYSIAEESAAVEDFLNACHLDRIDLGGWSMGGWIVMRIALDEPQRIRRLMIFDSAGLRWSFFWNPDLFEPDTPAKLQELDDLLMPTAAPHVPSFIERAIFHYVHGHGWVVRRNMDAMLTGQALLDGKLGALKMPMLIVWGKQDHLIPVTVGEAIHRDVLQSELAIFDGCGHLAAGQCASRVGPVVKGFLDEAAPMAGKTALIAK